MSDKDEKIDVIIPTLEHKIAIVLVLTSFCVLIITGKIENILPFISLGATLLLIKIIKINYLNKKK